MCPLCATVGKGQQGISSGIRPPLSDRLASWSAGYPSRFKVISPSVGLSGCRDRFDTSPLDLSSSGHWIWSRRGGAAAGCSPPCWVSAEGRGRYRGRKIRNGRSRLDRENINPRPSDVCWTLGIAPCIPPYALLIWPWISDPTAVGLYRFNAVPMWSGPSISNRAARTYPYPIAWHSYWRAPALCHN
jgi:hypothetical protein